MKRLLLMSLLTIGMQCGCAVDEVSTAQSALELDENGLLWIEVEYGTNSGSIVLESDPSASNGRYARVTSAAAGRLTKGFSGPDEQTTVYAWARVIAPVGVVNSVWVGIYGPDVRWEVPESPTWTWRPVVDLAGNRWSRTIIPGQGLLYFDADEAGLRIDRVLLTSDPDFVPVHQTVQAESATLVAPMRSALQRTAPPVSYIWVPNGAGTNGAAHLHIVVPRSDDYFVWGRFEAPTELDNSFYFHELGLPREVWDVEPASGWRWHVFDHSVALDGDTTYVVGQREDGTKLDKLVLTNDPGFSYVVELTSPPVYKK